MRFGRSGRVDFFDPAGLELHVGDRVLVETDDGPREAWVVIAPGQVVQSDLRGPLNPVLSVVEASPGAASARETGAGERRDRLLDDRPD